MATTKRSVQFANFICHFGRLEMLDLCEEVIIPAFTTSSNVRKYKDTTYFFYEVELVNLSGDEGQAEPAIIGRFVKNTVLQREQIYRDGKLVPSVGSLDTAPSSLFVLTFRDHKLLFLSENAGAPGIESFRSTIDKFIKLSHVNFIKKATDDFIREKFPNGVSGAQKSKAREFINEKYPRHNLEVVSIASEHSFESFVDKFDKLQTFSIKLLKPNNEIDNDGLFDKLRMRSDKLNASSAKLSYRNPDGLEKESVKESAESALDGNAEVRLSGTDSEGRKLSGSNDDFKIQVVVEGLPKSIVAAANKLYGVFVKYKQAGQVKTGIQSPSVIKEAKLAGLTLKILGESNGNT